MRKQRFVYSSDDPVVVVRGDDIEEQLRAMGIEPIPAPTSQPAEEPAPK